MALEKVYQVEFMQYTNFSKDFVSNGKKDKDDYKSINLGEEPFLVRESELDKYIEYGNGFRSIKFVGNINM